MTKVTFKFPLGVKVKDKVSGYVGVIDGRMNPMTGEVRYGVQGAVKGNVAPAGSYFDEAQLESVPKGARLRSQSVEFKFKLGDELEDNVTGFTGIAVSHLQYLNGCKYCQIQGAPIEGVIPQPETVSELVLKRIGEGINDEPVPDVDTGGPPSPSTRSMGW